MTVSNTEDRIDTNAFLGTSFKDMRSTCVECGSPCFESIPGSPSSFFNVGGCCGGCGKARYCSIACQKAGWKRVHKEVCGGRGVGFPSIDRLRKADAVDLEKHVYEWGAVSLISCMHLVDELVSDPHLLVSPRVASQLALGVARNLGLVRPLMLVDEEKYAENIVRSCRVQVQTWCLYKAICRDNAHAICSDESTVRRLLLGAEKALCLVDHRDYLYYQGTCQLVLQTASEMISELPGGSRANGDVMRRVAAKTVEVLLKASNPDFEQTGAVRFDDFNAHTLLFECTRLAFGPRSTELELLMRREAGCAHLEGDMAMKKFQLFWSVVIVRAKANFSYKDTARLLDVLCEVTGKAPETIRSEFNTQCVKGRRWKAAL